MPSLFAVLVTYKRAAQLERTLQALLEQTRRPDLLVVVDNHPDAANRLLLDHYLSRGLALEYLPATDNLGPAGGIALGMRRLLEAAEADDLILTLDDDDPPRTESLLEELEDFTRRMARIDPSAGGAGFMGARFDWRTARMVRVPDEDLSGPVAVDYIGGNQWPLYRVAAVKKVGVFDGDLFFGLEELEYGLRLRAAGFNLYAHGDLWNARRMRNNRTGSNVGPRVGLPTAPRRAALWRRYYTLRNLIVILRSHGRTGAALRVTLERGVAKPLVNLATQPRAAASLLRVNLAACRDGWRRNLGRTVEPLSTAGKRRTSLSPDKEKRCTESSG